jgi:hypothetical protein
MLTEHRSGDERPRTAAAACRPRKKALLKAVLKSCTADRGADGTAGCTAGGTNCTPFLRTRQSRLHSSLHSSLHSWLHSGLKRRGAPTTERKIIPFLAQKFLYRVLIDFTADERHEIRHTREEKNPLVSLKRTRRTSRLRAHRDLVAHMLMRSWLRS